MLTLVASALADGDCIDDADALRAGRTVGVLGCVVKASIHPGDLPAQLPVGACPSTRPREPPVVGPGLGRWGRTRRLAPDHRPGPDHLDETYGLAIGGSAPPRLYRRPRLSPAAGHCFRHRRGADVHPAARGVRANTARGAAHFLRETVGRVCYGGARGQLTVRADSGFYAHTVVAACREMDVRFELYHHPPARQPAGPDRGDTRGGLDSHSLLDGRYLSRCRRDDLHPVPDQAGRRAGAAHCPAGEADAQFPARPLRPDTAITPSSPTAMGSTLELEADHRRHAEVENAILRPQVRRRAEPHAERRASPPTAPGWRSR